MKAPCWCGGRTSHNWYHSCVCCWGQLSIRVCTLDRSTCWHEARADQSRLQIDCTMKKGNLWLLASLALLVSLSAAACTTSSASVIRRRVATRTAVKFKVKTVTGPGKEPSTAGIGVERTGGLNISLSWSCSWAFVGCYMHSFAGLSFIVGREWRMERSYLLYLNLLWVKDTF